MSEFSIVFYRVYGKRFFDIIFAFCGLIVCALPIAVCLSSPGSLYFGQLRVGRKGKMFVLYKFRSMCTSAPEKSNQDSSENAMNHCVTRLGRITRKTSIDELPQLINVLRGEMSFIGPRLLARTDDRVLDLRRQNVSNLIRPGISGLAQVNGRNEISDDMKAKWDAEYAGTVSMSVDLKILVRTFFEITSQRGINRFTKRK
ncbi:sugar transferase [Lacticaseibacillus paracasei]|uniref:sugar transferase n=1 Tax=Lacticaseibacillus paracasei TaxID=1597 RepID=UPI0025A27ED6|nr:sugar transferase [Lacticaseibacillus paracasei]MDM7530321.1 sugar transferase [Lacticaseibacillus paracasei]MDM7542663.1 sugar transferase [Lacticaseibacillus paracasei]